MPRDTQRNGSEHDGRARTVIEHVYPEVDCGRFAIKRVIGETVVVEADIFADGHDQVAAVLRHRGPDDEDWRETPFAPLVNDRWRAEFRVFQLGTYVYTIESWVDHFESWRHDFAAKATAGQATDVDLETGVVVIAAAAERAEPADADRLLGWIHTLRDASSPFEVRSAAALDDDLAVVAKRYPDRSLATQYEKLLTVQVDRVKARFSTWYEMFPRSAGPAGSHGTFRDVEARLPYVAGMGFDVLYLPPIHPIGRTFRKGRNNAIEAGPDDPGSPWAIGAAEGGHKSIHPQLGTLADFQHLVEAATDYGIEVALDIAYQATPDHPYVREHPEWFRHRPDGSIQYAENPPKKYQDIYPFDFEGEAWRALWEELKSIVEFWAEQGVRIFRVDNPHTKPFPFWEWLLGELRTRYPDAIFLAEAFTRPKVMYRLAKLGFTQSYTYFAWRNTSWELRQYFTELTTTEVREFFRPNLWVNTPDILTEYLQTGGRPAFMARLILAATLGASYGMYGPAFELMENVAIEPGKEEYLNAEKYEVRQWDIQRSDSLRDLIARVNHIRRSSPALQSNDDLRFVDVDNEQIIAYVKATPDRSDIILTVVNLDPYHTHAGWLTVPLDDLGIDPTQPFQAHDLLTDARYLWTGPRNYVELSPFAVPAHILRIHRRLRSERDFEYFM